MKPRAAAILRPDDEQHMREIRAALPEVAPDLLDTPTNIVRVALRLAAQELRRRRERRERIREKLAREAVTPSDSGAGASAP